jgi:hypothetical protein
MKILVIALVGIMNAPVHTDVCARAIEQYKHPINTLTEALAHVTDDTNPLLIAQIKSALVKAEAALAKAQQVYCNEKTE